MVARALVKLNVLKSTSTAKLTTAPANHRDTSRRNVPRVGRVRSRSVAVCMKLNATMIVAAVPYDTALNSVHLVPY